MVSKSTMVQWYANFAEIPMAQAKTQWGQFCEFLSATLRDGEEINLQGIGTMSVKLQKEMQRRNVRTGEPFTSPAKMVPHMKFTKTFKDAVSASVPVLND